MAQVKVRQNGFLVFMGDLQTLVTVREEENLIVPSTEEVYELADKITLKQVAQ